jgi:surface antigen
MTRFSVLALVVAGALSIGGCSVGGLGAIGPAPTAALPPPPGPAPAPLVYGSFLDGPVGQKLSQADKDKALTAEQDALQSGQRKTWKGEHGTFGYVEPGAAPAAPDEGGATCRSFTSTIYLAGRPQVGHGRGCQTPDGTYRIAA